MNKRFKVLTVDGVELRGAFECDIYGTTNNQILLWCNHLEGPIKTFEKYCHKTRRIKELKLDDKVLANCRIVSYKYNKYTKHYMYTLGINLR